ncbi:MAG TPA: hypothetical protein VHF50_03750 [Solirubrobacterales bacterium]|nr:hypothetical protein [Solirubrobacterales bacterium]
MGTIGIKREPAYLVAASLAATALALLAALALAAPAQALPQASINGYVGGPGGLNVGGDFTQARDVAVYTGNDADPANDKILVVESFTSGARARIQRLDRHGNFELAWGKDVVAAGAPGDTGTGFEHCTVASACKRGEAGGAAGELSGPMGIAFDQATAHVYVRDRSNHRVQEFELDGDFVRAWGWGVDTGAAQFEVCTAASGCQAGIAGAGAGQLGASTGVGNGIAIHPLTSDVFVSDPGNRRVLQFESDGDFVRAWGWGIDTGAAQFEVCTAASGCQAAGAAGSENGRFSSEQPLHLAVDEEGIVYASDSSEAQRVVRFDSDLAPAAGAAGAALLAPLPSPGLLAAGETHGLELDPDTGNLFALRDAGVPDDPFVAEIADAGAPIGGAPEPTLAETHVVVSEDPLEPDASFPVSLGFDPVTDNLYVVGTLFARAFPPNFTGCLEDMGPVSATCEGLLVLADGGPLAATFPALPDLDAEPIVASGTLDANGGVARARFQLARDAAEPAWQSVSGDRYAAGTEEVPISVELDLDPDSLEPNASYRLRMFARKQTGIETRDEVSIERSFTTPAIAPSAETISTSQRGLTRARIYGRVNPNNSPTEYWFEWGETSAYGNRTPVPDGDVGSDFSQHVLFAQLEGLEPGTTYHYRIAAINPVGTTFGEDATFSTRAAVGALPERAFELVTPPFKVVRAPVEPGAVDGNNPNPAVSSLDGEALLWNVPFFPLTEEVGWPDEGDKRIIRRTATGWVNETMNSLPMLEGYAYLQSQDVRASSADLETLAWGTAGGVVSWEQGGLLPTEGPSANRLYTRRSGTGTQGFTPWLTNPEAQVRLLGGPLAFYDSYHDEGDKAVLNDAGTAMARWGYYGGLAEDPTTPGDDDPSDDGISLANPLGGPMIYAQRADDPDQLPAAPKDLVNECTSGPTGATEVAAISGGAVSSQPCPAERPITSPLGAVVGGGSLHNELPGAGPASTALSDDGRRIFFTSPDPESARAACSDDGAATECLPQLFVRHYEEGGGATVRWISRSRSVAGPGNSFAGPQIAAQPAAMMGTGATFQGASRDGGVVYFQTDAPLVPTDPNGGEADGASPDSWDLYRYELPSGAGADPDDGALTRITGGPSGAADPNTNSLSGSLRYLSDDGSRAYFITAAPIPGVDTTPPRGGVTGPGGTAAGNESSRNLYLFDASQTGADRYRFVARLPYPTSSGGVLDLNGCAAHGSIRGGPSLNAGEGDSISFVAMNCFRGTPAGSHVAFATAGQLTGDDDDEAADIYFYDAEADELTRVSAPPAGAVPYICHRPTAGEPARGECNGDFGFSPAGFHTSIYGGGDSGRGWSGARYSNLAENPDGSLSVYFESRSQLVPEDTNGDHWDVYEWRAGELSLLSRAKAGHHSYYSGNGKDGRDVFIWTTDRIDPRELDDGSFDVYDLRRGGGFPFTAPPEPCKVLALACEGGAQQAPARPSPTTRKPNGSGNVATKPRRCPKGKVRRKGRCVKKARANKHRKGAKRKGRAGRAGKGGRR